MKTLKNESDRKEKRIFLEILFITLISTLTILVIIFSKHSIVWKGQRQWFFKEKNGIAHRSEAEIPEEDVIINEIYKAKTY